MADNILAQLLNRLADWHGGGNAYSTDPYVGEQSAPDQTPEWQRQLETLRRYQASQRAPERNWLSMNPPIREHLGPGLSDLLAGSMQYGSMAVPAMRAPIMRNGLAPQDFSTAARLARAWPHEESGGLSGLAPGEAAGIPGMRKPSAPDLLNHAANQNRAVQEHPLDMPWREMSKDQRTSLLTQSPEFVQRWAWKHGTPDDRRGMLTTVPGGKKD